MQNGTLKEFIFRHIKEKQAIFTHLNRPKKVQPLTFYKGLLLDPVERFSRWLRVVFCCILSINFLSYDAALHALSYK